MDKHQELRTNLVLEAQSALSAVKELSDGLDKIARLKFDNVKDGFNTLTKAFEAAQKMSSKVVKVQTEDEKKFQNLLQQRAKVMKEMLDGYSKDRGFAKTEKWDGLKSQFESANIEIANFMKLSGRASEAVKYLQEALIAVANTPLYDPLKNQLAKLKVDLQSIKNDVKDRVSELDGTKQAKIDKTVAKELARQDKERAKDNAAAQKEEISKAKELAAIKEASDKKEIQRQKEIEKLLKDITKLWKDIENHKGIDGQSYSKKGYDNTVNRIANLRDRATEAGLHGDAALLNPALLNGVNTKLGQLNNRISEAKDKAQQLFVKFQQTGSAVDKLSFMKAVNEFKRLEHISEDFNTQINKAARSALTLENIAKRAKEHFNWTAGAYVENNILSFPGKMVDTISKYEMAMAGVAQVIPKAEEGQRQLNSLFSGFSDVAAKYGQSVSDAMESAKSIGRMYGQGDGDHDLGAENTKLLTAQAAKMATVDNFSMIDATKGLESALAQFNLQTENTNLLMARSSRILDVWTKLAHTSGASAQDLTQGVNQAGSSAREAGVSFEFLNALIATGVRSTAKSGNEIGTTLKSMFASIQSDKAIKAMQKFGIEVYRAGANGRELRPMKDIILDISRALETTPKDTKEVNDFLLAISGGKFQVSKIAAILGNYKELVRTSKLAHDSSGFTDQQLDIQMNTVSRKFETLKANIDKLFVASGADGLANDLKWLLDVASRLAKALESSDTHFYKWAKYGTAVFIAWKAVPALFNTIAAAAGRASAAFNMRNTAGAMSTIGGAWSTQFEASKDKSLRKMQGLAYEADSMAVDKNSAALGRNTSQQRANDLVRRASISHLFRHNQAMAAAALSTNVMGVNIAAVTAKLKVLPLVSGAASIGITALSTAWRAMGAAVAFCGGPLGAIMTLLSVGGLLWSYYAEQEQKETEALEKKNEAIEKHIRLAQDSIENANENVKYAELLAQKYNKLVDEQKELEEQTNRNAEADMKHAKNKEELDNIQQQLKDTFHASSVEFDQDGKINQTTIDNLSKAHKAAMRQKLEADKAELISSRNKTEQTISDNTRQIESLKNLTAANWVYAQAIKFVHTVHKNGMKSVVDMDAKTIENIDQYIEEAQERGDTETVASLQKQREKAVEKQKRDNEEYNSINDKSPGEWWFTDEIEKIKGQNEDLKINLQKESASIKMIDVMLLSNMNQTGLSSGIGMSDEDVNAGKTHPLSDKELKEQEKAAKKAAREQAKLDRQKDIVSFRNDEVMDYVNTVSKETGALTIGQLLSFAAALDGHNDPWKVRADYFSDKNIFKVPDALTDKYSGGKRDEESLFWAFSKWLQDKQAAFGGYEGALKEYFKTVHPQTSNDEVKQLAEGWMNEGEYFDSKHDYSKNKSVLTHHSAYSNGYAGGDVITGSEYDEFINRMAERYGVDKVLAHQIAEQESTHGKASSNVFQVESATGREMGFSDMDDAYQSIEAGLKYFAKMLNESNGDIEEALRRYNGGGDPNYVENVLRHHYSPVGANGSSSIWDKANAHIGEDINGLLDYGAGAGNLDKQCAAFVSKVLEEAGVEGLSSVNVDRLKEQAEAQGLYHSADSGYQPQKGDVIIWGHHTGFSDGQGNYIARNSSEGVHFGNELDYRQIFGGLVGYISTGAMAGGSKQAAYQWKNSETGGQPTLLNWTPNKQNSIEEWLSRKQEWWKRQEQEIKMIEDEGRLAESIKNSSEVAADKAETHAIYLSVVKKNVMASYKKFLDLMGQDSDVQAALKRNGTSITQLSSADIDELIVRMKNSKKNVEELEKVWKVVKDFKFDSNGESEKLKQTDLEMRQSQIEAAKAKGYLTPREEEDYRLEALDLWYQQESTGKIFQDPRLEEAYHAHRADVYQRRLDRLQIEAQKADEAAPEEKKKLRQQVLAAKEARDNKRAELDSAKTPEEQAKLNKELEEAQKYLDLQAETWQDVEKYGTEAQRKVAAETTKTKTELDKEQKAANRVVVELTQKIGNGAKSMFSSVLLEGKSFSDAWQSLWTDIGKFALDRLLEIQFSRWGLGGLFGKASGGKIDGKANGGAIPRFATGGYTNGLIRGAGTGTSDSILTYLAHRGQFIATSNGEYIIQEKAVNKLGIPFLDMLNNNPDSIGALNGLKRYASGGNLGDSYAPSMSLKGVDAYKTFNKANMEKQQHFSTRRMEQLQQQTIDAITNGTGEGTVTQPVILNTQADSASVMKAIAKNPRALQAILGNNKRRGFR